MNTSLALAYYCGDDSEDFKIWDNNEKDERVGLTKAELRIKLGLHFEIVPCKKCYRNFKSQHRNETKIQFFCTRCRSNLSEIYDPTTYFYLHT